MTKPEGNPNTEIRMSGERRHFLGISASYFLRHSSFVIRHFAAAAMLLASWDALAADPTPQQLQFFENRVRPVLSKNCYKCHSQDSEKVKGRLMLDTKDSLLRGGQSGAAIVPGNPESSLLIKAIRYQDSDLQMPPKKQLEDSDIAALVAWVKMGAPDPRTAGAVAKSWSDAGLKHWAWQRLKKPPVPEEVSDPTWPKTPVDNFILAKLDEKG